MAARVYSHEEVAAFREAMAAPRRRTLIHAVYLINCASEDECARSR